MDAPAHSVELPPAVAAVLERLRAAGLPAWLVGGALRDLLRGAPARDFDLAVDAPLDAVARALPGSVRIDAAVPVVLVRGIPRIEIAPLRGGARDIETDLRRRDFTLNALAFDGSRLIDPLSGLRDLRRGVLRGAEPDRTFVDDPVRVLRGARLCSELELSLDPTTRDAMQRESWRLASAAGERVRDELFRVLLHADPTPPLRALREAGALAVILPELQRTIGVEQNAHHPHDVYVHTLAVCRACPPRAELRLAALLHDCAKPDTKRYSEKKRDFTFHRHETHARARVEEATRRLRLSRAAAEHVAALVRHHLLFPDRLQTDASVRRMLRRVGSERIEDLLALRRADYASRAPDLPGAWVETEERIRREARSAEEPCLAVSGADVIRELGVEPGREVGRWLRRLTQRVVERPEENERARLLAWLRAARDEEDA